MSGRMMNGFQGHRSQLAGFPEILWSIRSNGSLWIGCMAPAHCAGGQNNEARAISTRAFVAGAGSYLVALPSRKSWETAATKAREEGRTRVRPERISS